MYVCLHDASFASHQRSLASLILTPATWIDLWHALLVVRCHCRLLPLSLSPTVDWAGSFVPLLYPLYYVLLFVPRERDDDRICGYKYGKAWEEYKKAVPRRIFPFVY